MDLALNNLQSLKCRKTQPTDQPTIFYDRNVTARAPPKSVENVFI